MNKPRETFHLNPPIQVKEDCLLGLVDPEVYNSIFIITEENNKFKLYAGFLYNELSYTTFKDKIAKALGLSDISSEDLENEIRGRDIIEIYRKLVIEKSETDGYFLLLKRYLRTPFRDFESYLRILTGLNGDDIQLLLKQTM